MSTKNGNNRRPQKDIDLDLLIFIERYATNLLKWDILTFFGRHPNNRQTAQDIALEIGRSYRAIRPELGDLAMLGILNKFDNHNQPKYQLTGNPALRSLTLKFSQGKPPVSSLQDRAPIS